MYPTAGLPTAVAQQYADNERWLQGAGQHNLSVGSAARILYADQRGRVAIAVAFNAAVAAGTLKVPSHLLYWFYIIIHNLCWTLDGITNFQSRIARGWPTFMRPKKEYNNTH